MPSNTRKRTTESTAGRKNAGGEIVKRYLRVSGQYTYGLRIRAYGERYWVPLGTELDGWNDRRVEARRQEIATLVQAGVWRPEGDGELDPRESNPTFHEFASDWLTRYQRTVGQSRGATAESLLSLHVLPFLHSYRLDEINFAVLDAYVAHKLARNQEIEAARDAGTTLRTPDGKPRRTLGPKTINMTVDLIASILKDAVKRGLLPSNPAADRELRLKVTHRKGNFLEADELLSVIEAAESIDRTASAETLKRAEKVRKLRSGARTWTAIAAEMGIAQSTAIWLASRPKPESTGSVRRAIIATLACAGLRNAELCALNLGDLDFPHGVIHVRDSKTEAGIRQVNMTPWLHDELLSYRTTRLEAQLSDPAFPTRTGARRDRHNVNRRVIAPAIKAANEQRRNNGQHPLPDGVTPHTFRRTFITLMLEAGAPVPYVQAQVGHEDPKTTLEIYAQVLRKRDRTKLGEAFDALMSDAVPSGSSTKMTGDLAPDAPSDTVDLFADSDLFAHRKREN